MYIDGFSSKPRNSILLNVQERQKKLMGNPPQFNMFDLDKLTKCVFNRFLILGFV